MAKGQEKSNKNNKPKLSPKEKAEKKKAKKENKQYIIKHLSRLTPAAVFAIIAPSAEIMRDRCIV